MNLFKDKSVTSIAVGLQHTLILLNDSRILAFGANTYSSNTGGMLGNNDILRERCAIYFQYLFLQQILSCASYANWCVGRKNNCANCSHCHVQPRTLKVRVFSFVSHYSDGIMYSWGDYRILGAGNSATLASNGALEPVQVMYSGTPMQGKTIVQISGGGYHVLALSVDGLLFAFGQNTQGQLGEGTVSSGFKVLPVAVKMDGNLIGKNIFSIVAGGYTSFALSSVCQYHHM